MKEQLWLNWTNRGMNLILTCLGPLDYFSDDELLLTETDLTGQKETTEQTEIGQLNDEDIDNFITENRNGIEANCKRNFFFSNSNWTEWSTIQGVIGRVISNRPSAKREADLKLRARLLPELYDTKSNY